MEVSVRIFTDDFEKTLRKNCNCKVDLAIGADKTLMNDLVRSYVTKNVKIKIDGQWQQLQYSGYQKEDESTWSYFEIKNIKSFKKLEMSNSLLHDYKEEQINMIHVKAKGKEVTDKLNFPDTNFSIIF